MFHSRSTNLFRFRIRGLITTGLLIIVLVSCTNRNEEQLPVEVKWDRAVCIDCRMAISDNRYAAQVVGVDGKAYLFDDIGCAILWLQRQEGMDKARIWVNDRETSEWIEAKKANWIFGDEHTPMGFGFAATLEPVDNPMKFETVVRMMVIGDTLVNRYLKKHLESHKTENQE